MIAMQSTDDVVTRSRDRLAIKLIAFRTSKRENLIEMASESRRIFIEIEMIHRMDMIQINESL